MSIYYYSKTFLWFEDFPKDHPVISPLWLELIPSSFMQTELRTCELGHIYFVLKRIV